ncbi:uncharacterized protein J8A68_002889 [[Candida] subhashii]|uniref:SCP domain-containing protein n=1 Tax=[Candida] subhashii TaxID=561895 RepID=A0A8J5QWP7_9ASCO|nr:uncharacterized protein J8A68_002889 [[Candida] subhashii]KAG7663640.1 hypothetical protein J8A68_002889 [[Candida] subhashii]
MKLKLILLFYLTSVVLSKTVYVETVVTVTPTSSSTIDPPSESSTKKAKTIVQYVVETVQPEGEGPTTSTSNKKGPTTVIQQVVVTHTPSQEEPTTSSSEVQSEKKAKTVIEQVVVTVAPSDSEQLDPPKETQVSETDVETQNEQDTPAQEPTEKETTVVVQEVVTEDPNISSTDVQNAKTIVEQVVVAVIPPTTLETSYITGLNTQPTPVPEYVPEIDPSDPLAQEIYSYTGPYILNQTFSDIMLADHNKKRARHGVAPLRWSNEVFNFAASYAEQYACTGKLKHSGGMYGENLAIGYSPLDAMNTWYIEGEEYEYGTENVYDHFTAIVWNSTTSVGCAYKVCENLQDVWYIVCNYDPHGNIIGFSSRNVFPPLY